MNEIHGGRIQDYINLTGLSPTDIIDFSANINPLGPPQSVKQAVVRAIDEMHHYPDAKQRIVKDVLSQRFAIPASELVCGNGATEVFDLFFHHVKPRQTIVLQPAFSEYAMVAKRHDSRVVEVHMPIGAATDGNGEGIDRTLQQVDDVANPGDVVVLNNPHNPTGLLLRLEEWLSHILRWSERGIYTLIDESFMDFAADAEPYTALSLAGKSLYIFIVKSATKMYAIPGLRFGFGIGHQDLVAQIERDRDGWSVNHLAQVAATAGYQDVAFERDTWAWLRAEQAYIRQTWGSQPAWQFTEPGVNFFFVRLPDGTAQPLMAHLQAQGMFIRPCGNFVGLSADHVRIAIRSHAENERLWQAVARFFNLRA